jgi:hypothetical protein
VEHWNLDLNENRRRDGLIIEATEGYPGYFWLFDHNEDDEYETLGHDKNADFWIDEYEAL